MSSRDAVPLLFYSVLLIVLLIGIVQRLRRRARVNAGGTTTGHVDSIERGTFLVGSGRSQYRVSGVRLNYVFTVGGEFYGGTLRLAGFSTEQQIQDYCARLKGQSVIVHYDTKDSNLSEVRLRENPMLDISGVTGLGMTVLGESTDCIDFVDLIPDDVRHAK